MMMWHNGLLMFLAPHYLNIHIRLRQTTHFFSLKTQKLAPRFAFSCFLFVTLQAISRGRNRKEP